MVNETDKATEHFIYPGQNVSKHDSIIARFHKCLSSFHGNSLGACKRNLRINSALLAALCSAYSITRFVYVRLTHNDRGYSMLCESQFKSVLTRI